MLHLRLLGLGTNQRPAGVLYYYFYVFDFKFYVYNDDYDFDFKYVGQYVKYFNFKHIYISINKFNKYVYNDYTIGGLNGYLW